MTYDEFIRDILDTRGRFACGEEYHERHHIIPKCMGGTNDEENLIDLFAREHFVAHKLLVQENPKNDNLIFAWGCMAWAQNKHQERYELTPLEYEEAKQTCVEVLRKKAKERLSKAENNPMYGKHRFGEENPMWGKHHSEETRQILSEKGKMRFPNKESHPWFGRHHTEESKQKMRDHHADVRGEKHPMYNKKHTEETRKKMGENHKSMRGKNSPLSRVVEQYTLQGDFINVFDSTGEASRATNIDSSSISRCANGKLKSAGGFIWKYLNENKE